MLFEILLAWPSKLDIAEYSLLDTIIFFLCLPAIYLISFIQTYLISFFYKITKHSTDSIFKSTFYLTKEINGSVLLLSWMFFIITSIIVLPIYALLNIIIFGFSLSYITYLLIGSYFIICSVYATIHELSLHFKKVDTV